MRRRACGRRDPDVVVSLPGGAVPSRVLRKGSADMAKVVCVLYDDPVDGYPKSYARDGLPQARHAIPAAKRCRLRRPSTFTPGSCSAASPASSGCANSWKRPGHKLVVTSDKDGPNSVLRTGAARRGDRHLAAVLARLSDGRADRQGPEAQARRSPRASARITSICRPRSTRASPWPKSPTATASASPSTS